MKRKIFARLWNGDDKASWAIFVEGQSYPVVSSLLKSQIPYYKKRTEELLEKKKGGI